MRKCVTVFAAVALCAGAAFGQKAEINQGTKEVRLGGGIDLDTFADTRLSLDGGLAYFVQDAWQVGILGGVQHDDFVTFWEIGFFTEYNLDMGHELVPYVGAALYFSGSDIDDRRQTEAAIWEVALGGKYFFRPQMAVFSQIEFRFATDDVFDESDGDISDSEIRIRWGLRFFFD